MRKRPTTVTYLRIPTGLRAKLSREAARQGRTLTAQIEVILKERYK
jgi:hypothetical protein